ncbi:hypothetical protein [Microbacterium sp. NPDC087589]|uniref:hypothetical protein n=1 Tax=Microbacterium sp. NPDC087589 TaxID=3364191 RepID=UPI00380F1E38
MSTIRRNDLTKGISEAVRDVRRRAEHAAFGAHCEVEEFFFRQVDSTAGALIDDANVWGTLSFTAANAC